MYKIFLAAILLLLITARTGLCEDYCNQIIDSDLYHLCNKEPEFIKNKDLRYLAKGQCNLIENENMYYYCTGENDQIIDRNWRALADGNCHLISEDQNLYYYCKKIKK
ncbi:hypothetical protein SAMN05660337_0949 [Maridesulfovibrio ferrireducens]|uniref:Uncharacterized protein n=1 Tax=Maridesulfovibrio ferrireducens TaxID=246191 RepID=A0A1G9D8N2_9BACT|nr:hypothetical protein [Maridesulfovibrio ferrireducens]SDK60094.1 hypothetical protein SAMN05660337_0949 [Maridesulfovibrio ferrireducens]